MPFADTCDALGVTVNLSESYNGKATISNTHARVQELCNDLMEVIDAKHLTPKAAQRLRGRMQFADAQVFGRTGRRCLRVLTNFSEGHKMVLQDKDVFFLEMFIRLLRSNVPREVRFLSISFQHQRGDLH